MLLSIDEGNECVCMSVYTWVCIPLIQFHIGQTNSELAR